MKINHDLYPLFENIDLYNSFWVLGDVPVNILQLISNSFFYAGTIYSNRLFLTSFYLGLYDVSVSNLLIQNVINKVNNIIFFNIPLNSYTLGRYNLKSKKIIHISSNIDDYSNLSITNYYFYLNDFDVVNSCLIDYIDKLSYNKVMFNLLGDTNKEKNFLFPWDKFFGIVNKDVIFFPISGILKDFSFFTGNDSFQNKLFNFIFPSNYFTLGSVLAALSYSFFSNDKVIMFIGDGEFIKFYGDIIKFFHDTNLVEKDITIIIINNKGYKSLSKAEYNKFNFNFEVLLNQFDVFTLNKDLFYLFRNVYSLPGLKIINYECG